MKTFVTIIMIVAIASVAPSQTMYVHTTSGTTSFNLAQIDSITFTVQYDTTVPTQGLVAYYPFNGNANDESGNGNNGIDSGATLTTDRFGNANKAYWFNGTSNYIEVSDNPILRFSNSFSISLWVSLTNPYRLDYNMTLIGKALGSDYKDSYTIYTGYWGADTGTN